MTISPELIFLIKLILVSIDNDFKLIATSISEKKFELYNLRTDPGETQNISTENPRLFTTMKEEFLSWNQSVDSSFAGLDYKEKKVLKI